MTRSRNEQIDAADGDHFDAHVVIPDSGAGPGILVIQEIWGVNDYIKEAGERLAELGYVTLAPDLFWRMERNVALPHDDEGLQKGLELGQRLDPQRAVEDCNRAFEHLSKLPEVRGRPGVLGFCLGGSLAYFVAASGNPTVAVSYYGSAVPDALDQVERISCPILFHFGGADPYIPRERIEDARRACEGRPHVEFHVHEGAGHAFENYKAPMFHNPEAARAAWKITADFLRRNLPVTQGAAS
jgi:carboxymethylenebutenolidase